MAVALDTSALTVTMECVQPNGSTLFPNDTRAKNVCKTAYTAGTTANKCNVESATEYTIPASETLTLDVEAGTYALSGGGSGTIVDLNGATVTFARIKQLFARLLVGTGRSKDVKLNGAASNVVCANTFHLVSDGTNDVAGAVANCSATGWAVTNTTADKIVIVNNEASPAHVLLGIGGGAT